LLLSIRFGNGQANYFRQKIIALPLLTCAGHHTAPKLDGLPGGKTLTALKKTPSKGNDKAYKTFADISASLIEQKLTPQPSQDYEDFQPSG